MLASSAIKLISLAFAAQTASAQISTAQIESVFGSNAEGLTGSSTSLPMYDLSIITNSTHALVTMNATTTAPSSIGWLGMGVGTAMANADFLVAWMNGGQWVLSHRITTGGEFMPRIATTDAALATDDFYTVIPSLTTTSSSSSFACVSFLRLLQFPANYPANTMANNGNLDRTMSNNLIYASSSIAPSSGAQDATLQQHNQPHARTSLDLSQAVSLGTTSGAGGSTGGTTSGGATSGGSGTGGVAMQSMGRTKEDMILIAHATLGSLAMMIFMPLAILIGRFMRTTRWFPLHVAFNMLAVGLIIAAFATATYLQGGNFGNETHFSVGLAILIIALVQVLIGYGAHRTKSADLASGARFPTLVRKSPVRHVHMIIGLVLLGIGWWNVNSGFDLWPQYSDAQTSTPRAVVIVYWIVLGVSVALYALGWVAEGLGKSNHQALRSDDNLPSSRNTKTEMRHA